MAVCSIFLRNIPKKSFVKEGDVLRGNPSNNSLATIWIEFSWSGFRLRKSTGQRVKVCDWIESNKRGLIQRINPRVNGSKEVNSDIEDLISLLFSALRDYERQGIIPTYNQIESLISPKKQDQSSEIQPTIQMPEPIEVLPIETVSEIEETKEDEVIEAFKLFIKATEDGTRKTRDEREMKPGTVEVYRTTIFALKRFKEHENILLTWDSLNDQFYSSFSNYLWDVLNHYDNSVGKIITKLKTFLNWCVEEKIISDKKYSKKWRSWDEDIEIMVLYPDEIRLLYTIEVPEDLIHTRDIFLAGCMTCLRVSNLLSLTQMDLVNMNGLYLLNVISVKSEKPLNIEVSPILYQIFLKYWGQYDTLLPTISDVKFNVKLKELAKFFKDHFLKNKKDIVTKDFIGNDWNRSFVRIRYKRGTPIKQLIPIEKVISSHTMRRTGITNLLMMGLTEIEVKTISGHSFTSRSFGKYVKIAAQFVNRKSKKAWDTILGKAS